MVVIAEPIGTFEAAHWTQRLGEAARRHNVPGAALAVLVDGEIHEAATGVINRRTGVEATPDTLFQIGSITKVWTTTMMLGLVDEGLVDLDVPVRSYVPELRLRDDEVASRLAVRHLLNHTSGLPGDFFPDTGRGDDCLEKYLGVLADVELAHPLGTLFSYSNAAFVLAGLVIERVTGTTWDAALRDRLIAPLGLTRTVTLPEDALLHRAAVGHLGVGNAQHVAPQWVLPRNCGPAGLIAAQARDVVEFALMHLDGGVARSGNRVLSEDSVALMQRATVDVPGIASARGSIGLGWVLASWSDAPVLQHDGGTIGQTAALRVLPRSRAAIALLCNGGDWVDFRESVFAELVPTIAGVTPNPLPTPVDPPGTYDADELLGSYRNIGSEITVTRQDGRLFGLQRSLDELEALAGQETVTHELLPQGDDVFLVQTPGTAARSPVVFLRDEHGAVEYLHFAGRAARRQ